MNNHDKQIITWQNQINSYLRKILPKSQNTLHQAMRYSVLNGGKRIRSVLCYSLGNILNANTEYLNRAAASLELIHAYTLIHDDLPAMDDDDLRRGKPSCHKQFNEATAILAGDALQSLAFEILLTDSHHQILPMPSKIKINMSQAITKAIGPTGITLGQDLDLKANKSNTKLSLEQLYEISNLKTGLLITSAMQLAMHAANISTESDTWNAFNLFGQKIGLAFQIVDDILDLTQTEKKLGKPSNSDLKNNKLTIPMLLGLKESQQKANQELYYALTAIKSLDLPKDKLAILEYIASYVIKREY